VPSVLILLVIGGTSGFLAGMLGAGGGFATVVLLVAAGVDVHTAVGTSLVFVMLVAAWGAAIHIRQGHARGRLGIAIGLSAAVTAPLGANLAHALSDRTLTVSFAMLMSVVAVLFVLRPDVRRRDGLGDGIGNRPIAGAQVASRAPLQRRVIVGAALGGGAIGILQGLFGVGGGFLLVPFMVMGLGVGEHRAIANSLVAILIGGISGSITHASLGSIATGMLGYLLPGGVLGVIAGALAVRHLAPRTVRIAFVTLVGVSSVYLVLRAFI
jgi:hypothetical protein